MRPTPAAFAERYEQALMQYPKARWMASQRALGIEKQRRQE